MAEIDTIALLTREYFELQQMYEAFDEKSLTIKGWAVSIALAGVVTAILKHNRLIVAFSGASAVLFWIIDALWRTFAWGYAPRISLIEKAMREPNVIAIQEFLRAHDFHHLQIYSAWYAAWNSEHLERFWTTMGKMGTFLPHAVVIVLCLILWFMWPRLNFESRAVDQKEKDSGERQQSVLPPG